jgi:outer membrane protein assembly factor BamA
VFGGRAGWRANRNHIFLGGYGAVNLLNVGPGTGEDSPSTSRIYSPVQAPGLDRQANYVLSGPFAHLDFRDVADDPHRGASVAIAYLFFNDYNLNRYSFRRLDAQVEQYVPYLNKKRVFAFRARTQLSYVNRGNIVPFYVQPTLGGGDDLRGFEQYRFTDNNSFLLSAEHRWEVSTALDVAAFVDAGTVFRRPGLIGFREMREDGGIGFRVKNRRAVVMRLDLGMSSEGFHIWFRFGNAFPLYSLFRQ